ncbi:MAG: HNH endonuclease [Syntrophothermus sp.]|uniref:RNA-guided endonuclease IscB n=1 Tax=Syntrophothermus sp. TaxID=2736299 RepID=UPI00257B9292|nr:RNA-guided endonuclease IscB [Syntrophothermus sp.]NSW83919.1 HNH endonuclease [Syntrophothermus sp.]
MVYVLSKDREPLMPTKRYGKVRRLLKNNKAKVIRRKPFTIQLLYETTTYTQPITLGIDSGYNYIGFSAVTEKEELISGEVTLLQDISERLKERAMYRRQRRNRLRYRKPRFDNRRKPEGWLPPSIQHKYDSHVRFTNLISSILPITKVVIEVASFDIQKTKNPDIEGVGYQNGEQKGFYNLREYILYRDNYACQLCGKGNLPLEVHHIGYWKQDRTDRPSNLITLCINCHTPENHLRSGKLWGWQPKLQPFKEATFMSIVRWKLVNTLGCKYTYGYVTKAKRKALMLEKTHYNDAFIIAGGSNQKRVEPIYFEQVRRNNRSLEKFYDAKYIDTRTGKPATGQELFNGRRVRNKNYNTENLRKYRGQKLFKGRRSIRKQRYFYQPKDVVIYEGQKYIVKGVQNRGAYIKLEGLPKPVRIELVKPYLFRKGFCAV